MSGAAPAATIVIPTRGRPVALLRCVAALLAVRDIPHLELIIVDDATEPPVETSAELRAMLEDPRAPWTSSVVIRGHGRGPAAARNLGVAAARHPIVVF